MVCLGPVSTNHDQNQTDFFFTYSGLQFGIMQMQLGNLNNFDYDRMRMDQDLQSSCERQFSTQLTAPILL